MGRPHNCITPNGHAIFVGASIARPLAAYQTRDFPGKALCPSSWRASNARPYILCLLAKLIFTI